MYIDESGCMSCNRYALLEGYATSCYEEEISVYDIPRRTATPEEEQDTKEYGARERAAYDSLTEEQKRKIKLLADRGNKIEVKRILQEAAYKLK